MTSELPYLDLGAGGIVVLVVLLILSDRLVTRRRLTEVQEDRDKWQAIALKSLGITETLTVSSEVTAEVLSRLPDPGDTP